MGGSKKKRRNENASESSDSTDPKEIQVDFEAFPLDDTDYGGISALLKQLFGIKNTDIDFGGLADLLIKQSPIGTVLKPSPAEDDDMEVDDDDIDETDAVFGISSVLDLSQDNPAISSLRTHLVERVGKAKKKTSGDALGALKTALGGRVALLLCERLLNIPHQVALPSLKALLTDMSEGGAKWAFESYVVLVKIHAQQGDAKLPPVFANAEEELLAEDNKAWAEWVLSDGEAMSFEDASFTSKRRLCLLSHAQLLAYVAKLEKELA